MANYTARHAAKPLTQHAKVCFECTLPECTPNSPDCAYWAGAPPWMRARSTVPSRWLKTHPEFLQTTHQGGRQ
jgi:hypothetical protein